MSKPSPARQVIDEVQRDPDITQLREKLQGFEERLQKVQDEISESLTLLRAKLNPQKPDPQRDAGDYASMDIDLLVRPTRTIEALRDQIREKRMEENECAEGVRIIRNLLKRKEDERYYAEFRNLLAPEQVRIGGRSVDRLLDLAELWHEERALRAPLLEVGRFEIADIWATHVVGAGQIRERIQILQRHGFEPSAEQLRRLDAVAKAEQ